MNKKVVVFGATGNLGAPVCVKLKNDGYDVIAVGGRKDDHGFFKEKGMSYYSVNIKDKKSFEVLDEIGDVYAVCHFAGSLPSRYAYDPQDLIESITVGTLNVLLFMRKQMRGEEHVKKINWHDSYNFFIKGVKGSWQSRMSKGDKFYKLFLGDCALGPQCYYRCKYKYDKSSADIRICDLSGKTYQDYADGVSGSIAFTERGKEILNAINCHLTVQPFEIVAQGQMRACPSYKHWYKKVEDVLADQSASINDAIKIVDHERKIDQWKYRFRHPVPTVCKIIKKI